MKKHNTKELAFYILKEMKIMGFTMHKAASNFTMQAQKKDMKKTLQALSKLTQNCIACHQTFKLK